jgi:hypothetical protein
MFRRFPRVSASCKSLFTIAAALFSLLAPGLFAPAQAQTSVMLGRPEVRLTQKIDSSVRFTQAGSVSLRANAANDRGAVSGDAPMQRMVLSLTHSDAQEEALQSLLAAQQDRQSPLFHKWLTPEQYGQQFGASDADIATLTAWLNAQGFSVSKVGNGRAYIEFNGTVAQVQAAFQTTIHNFQVDGATYQANATSISIPAALAPVVRGVLSLNNFPRQMHHVSAGTFSRDSKTGKLARVTLPSTKILSAGDAEAAVAAQKANNPNFTIGTATNNYGVTPYDFATIYNVLPLWNAGIDGTGQSIAVLEETDIHIDDVRSFRSIFGLPAKDPVIITNGTDPGVTSTDEEGEAVLDTEWAGAVAKGATIDFVTSASTTATAGIDLSAIYAVDYNVSPITSLSYGFCEPQMGAAQEAFYVSLWQQGAAQGISHFVSTGDSGSDGCDDNAQYATSGVSVSGFASTPYNTAVGGTDFLGTIFQPTSYWSSTNNATTQASALSYIPETTWNNNCTNFVFQTAAVGGNKTYANYASPAAACKALGAYTYSSNGDYIFLSPVGGSGGASTYSTKPSWQTGVGVPADGHRDLPDVSLLAANGSVPFITDAGSLVYYGTFYLVCQEDTNTNGASCTTTNFGTGIGGVGGTSVSTPAFAGIMAMVNQKTNERQGVANYVLYDLFNQQTTAGTNCTSGYATTGSGPYTIGAAKMPAAGCVFNDIVQGSNSAGCLKGATDCYGTNTYDILGSSSSGPEAYLNTPGYDLATGLGSVNAANLVNDWANVTFVPTATTLSLNKTTITHGASVNATITVAPASGGAGTPTGLVQLDAATTPSALGPATLSNGTVTQAYTNLPGGTYNLTGYYAGDATYASSTSAPVSVTVNPEASTLTGGVQLENESSGALSAATTCAYGAQCYLNFTPAGTSGQGTPTGTITILNSGATFATAPLASGSVQIDTTGQIEGTGAGAFAPGTYSFSASYSGDASFNASSTTSNVALTINKSGTKTSLARGTTSIAAGASETLTATVVTNTSLANGDDFGAFPSGTVTFYSGGTSGTNLGTVQFSSGSYNTNSDAPQSIATLTTTGLPYTTTGTSSDSITAVYSGDTNYTTSTSSAGTVTVAKSTKVATTSAVTATNTPLTYGTSTTLTDTITFTGSTKPTGSVQFYVDGTATGATVTIANATSTTETASLTIAALTGGSHQITATYAGDTTFTGSTGSLTLSVATNAADTLSLTASPSGTVAQGTSINFTATLSFTTGLANPTGNIVFTVDGSTATTVAALPFNGGGLGAIFNTSALAPGTHTIAASYAGDANYASATATSVSVTIVTAPQLTLTTMQNTPVVLGAPVTINAAVTPTTSGPVPTGTISYSVDGGASTMVNLTNGNASFTLSGLSMLKHVVTVVYNGDTTYISVTQTITLNGDVAQAILFAPLPNVTYAAVKTVALSARTTSGILVAYSITGQATYNSANSMLTLTGTGTVSVTASAAANGNFAAATSVTRSFSVQ